MSKEVSPRKGLLKEVQSDVPPFLRGGVMLMD